MMIALNESCCAAEYVSECTVQMTLSVGECGDACSSSVKER